MFIVPSVSAIASVGLSDAVVGSRRARGVLRAWVLPARRAAERSDGLKWGSALVVAWWEGAAAAGAWVTACDGAAERPAAVTAAIAPIVARRFTYYLQVNGFDDAMEARKGSGRDQESCGVAGVLRRMLRVLPRDAAGAMRRNSDEGHDQSQGKPAASCFVASRVPPCDIGGD